MMILICSTGVCDRKLVQCTIAVAISGHVSTSVWAKLEFEDEIKRLKQKIDQRLSKMQTKSESAPLIKTASLKIEEEYFLSQKTQPENSPFHQVVEETSALIVCYDCGGQPEFFDVMPALITAPIGYVICQKIL